MTTDCDINQLRARITEHIPIFNDPKHRDTWWLLGTSGCHLCTDAEQLMMCFQAVYPIVYKHVDIADFDETFMMAFATTIPVLLTPSKRLDYPFSVMDLQQLVMA